MNIHPIFVHFPVALLSLYAILELVRFKKVLAQAYWFYIKALLVMVGGLGALAAYFTGDMAKFAVDSGNSPVGIENFRLVVRVHENYALGSVAVFGIIAASYLVLWLNREDIGRFFSPNSFLQTVWQMKIKVAHFLVETNFVVFLALLGLICITITGGLGGVMVYGPAADPFFGAIYKMMFP